MTTFAITTLGCKVNTYESQGYAQSLIEEGFIEVSFKDQADIYLINTCAVTNTAASKSRQRIHQAQRQNPNALIVVVGCYVQTASDQLKEDLQIDLLVGSDQKLELPHLIKESLHNRTHQVLVHDMRKATVFEALPVRSFTHQTRAYLKIQDGCNQFCSYCIIPYARGAERSLAPDEVIAQAKALVLSGHLEIVLTGIHTGRYGREHNTTLAQLLERLCKEVPELKRIRISSIEMNEVSDELIALMKQEPRIARHLHIPIQAASDEVLAGMNRPYTMKDYTKRIHEIRQELPQISISTDIITGFPQESEAMFMEGLKQIEELNLSFLHVFPFSKRDGTKAAMMKGHLDHKTKKERTNKMMELSSRLERAYMQTFIGACVEVLWEREEDDCMFGHTSEYLGVYAPLDRTKLHTMQKVMITAFEQDRLQCIAQEVSV